MSLETDTELSEFLSTAHTGPGMHSRWSKQCVFLPSKTLKAWDLFGPWLLCENIIYQQKCLFTEVALGNNGKYFEQGKNAILPYSKYFPLLPSATSVKCSMFHCSNYFSRHKIAYFTNKNLLCLRLHFKKIEVTILYSQSVIFH